MCVVCAEEAAEEEEPGIQNQKQEPHTKMWGKKHICIYTVFVWILRKLRGECPVVSDPVGYPLDEPLLPMGS